jgi:hypothetical protein
MQVSLLPCLSRVIRPGQYINKQSERVSLCATRSSQVLCLPRYGFAGAGDKPVESSPGPRKQLFTRKLASVNIVHSLACLGLLGS